MFPADLLYCKVLAMYRAMFSKHKKRIVSLFLFLLLMGGSFFFAFRAQGVTRTWDGGGGDANWDTAANWSGDTVPTSSDVASFDGTCVSNCSPAINTTVNVAGISMAADYAGTITQLGTNAITVGSSHWIQAGGTFTGGSGNIDINGTFTLSGGTFISTSATLELGRDASETVFNMSAGTFNHNSGRIKFTGGFSRTYTVDLPASSPPSFYDMEVWVGGSAGNVIPGTGDTIVVLNDLFHTQGQVNGAWELQGDITISSGALVGTGTITFTGTNDQTYAYTASGQGAKFVINKSSGSVSPAEGTTDLKLGAFDLSSGTFTAPSGTLTLGRNSSETVFGMSGGTFNHNSGTVKFLTSLTSYTFTVDLPASSPPSFYNVEADLRFGCCGILNLGSGDAMVVLNTFTHTGGQVNGSWEVQGNVVIGTSANGGSATLTFSGGNDQTYTDQGGNEINGDITINKTNGSSVILASNADWNASGQDLTITAGVFLSGDYNVSTTALTVGASGAYRALGTGDLTLAGNVSNSGEMTFRSSNACGGADSILIRSSAAVQRSWSGSGTFTFHDVDVQYQAGTASVTVYSGTDSGNNGANWTFSGAVCPGLTAIPPKGQLQSGRINLRSGRFNP
jgi:hypothetical protein